MRTLKWEKVIFLSLICVCVGGMTGGCGYEEDTAGAAGNEIGLERMTEIEDLEAYDNMKYEDGTENGRETAKELENFTDSGENAYEIYEEFLAGKRLVCDEETGEEEDIYTLMEAENGTYLYCDINGDMTEELHVKSDQCYYILQAEGSNLEILYSGTVYECPVNEEDAAGVLYYRPGDAPRHDTYEFHVFGLLGETRKRVSFEWYDNNGNGEMDEEDMFLYDERETVMKEWLEQTQAYRDLDVENEVWENW